MPIDFTPLDTASRLLVEAELKVATGGGGRFQPTGFPNLGPALFRGADGTNWLLVESFQSMANRLELASWDEAAERYDEVCHGIPFVRSTVTLRGGATATTSSVQESHRLASPYILDGRLRANRNGTEQERRLWEELKDAQSPRTLGLQDNIPFLLRNHAGRLLRLDAGSLLHGVWLSTKVEPDGRKRKALCGGKIRFPRMLSAVIEAKEPQTANSGGVKRERIMDQAESGSTDAESGFGSVPFPRTDFTSPEIKAYFSFDLQLLRTCALGSRTEQEQDGRIRRVPASQVLTQPHNQSNFTDEEAFLILWALYKIKRFLTGSMALRSGCTFKEGSLSCQEPSSFSLPTFEEIHSELISLRQHLFQRATDNTVDPARDNITTVSWQGEVPIAAADTAPHESGGEDAGNEGVPEGGGDA
ncbi:MAG TPA: type I-U CRISPR-associated RAMP protein Csb1/Cas7u [Fimbriimonadaceae bacterium]|nr:type I-U CRISPR-associated RAMP protein Csb1/Cas7u [Fimbriimonadaceae bacterium]